MKLKKITKIICSLATASTLVGCSSVAIKQQTTNLKSNEISTKRLIEFESDGNGFNTKTYFYVGKEEVIAFDSQFTEGLANQAVEHLRKFTQKPITKLVVTHPNPDKFNGTRVFKNLGAQIVASNATKKSIQGVHDYKKYFFVEMAKMFTNNTYPNPASIDVSFENNMTIDLIGGEKIELIELSMPGVSTNQTVALLPNKSGLIVGDLVHNKTHAWLEGGIVEGKATPTIDSWQNLLRTLENQFDREIIVYGGRGENGALHSVINEQINYLEVSKDIVENYALKLKQNDISITSENASAHHEAITREFEAAFPNYQHSYMIQYGVYGLLNASLL